MFKSCFLNRKVLSILVLFASLPLSVLASGFVWTETQPLGDTDQWWHVTLSLDGQYMVGAVEEGRMYYSSNRGGSWAETQPAGNTTKDWRDVNISDDGSVILAASYIGRLYLSTTSASTWVETQPSGNSDRTWIAVDMSNNGQVLMAAQYNNRLYVSTTTGATWSEVRPVGDLNKQWRAVSVSGDGATLFAAVEDGRLYVSTTTGATWSEVRPAGDIDKSWFNVATNNDGSILIAGTINGSTLYRSTNGRVTWEEIQPTSHPSAYWQGLGMSNDGSIIALADGTTSVDDLHVSHDGGDNWELQYMPVTGTQRSWREVHVSGNGDYALAGSGDGVTGGDRIFIGTFDDTNPSTPGVPETSSPTENTTPSWTWSSSTDSAAGLSSTSPYYFEWSTDSNFASGVNNATSAIPTFTHVSTLTSGTWYFRVRASDAVNNYSSYATGSVTITEPETTSSGGGSSGGRRNKSVISNTEEDSENSVVSTSSTQNQLIAKLQDILRGLGFYKGSSTGLLDQVTIAAVQAFLEKSGREDIIYPKYNITTSKLGDLARSLSLGRDLSLGMTGEDVRSLQVLLNSLGYQIAENGIGSLGNESTYFGQFTELALRKLQIENSITPALGYFGPRSKTYLLRATGQ